MSSETESIKDYLKKCFERLNMNMDDSTCQKVAELGVDTPEDLCLLEESDLGFMKPIHVRKLLGYVKRNSKYSFQF